MKFNKNKWRKYFCQSCFKNNTNTCLTNFKTNDDVVDNSIIIFNSNCNSIAIPFGDDDCHLHIYYKCYQINELNEHKRKRFWYPPFKYCIIKQE